MHITGDQLTAILGAQQESVEIRNGRSYPIGTASPEIALGIVERGRFAGVGNAHRIRYIKPDDHHSGWPGGSHTTERIRNDQRIIISPPLIRPRNEAQRISPVIASSAETGVAISES